MYYLAMGSVLECFNGVSRIQIKSIARTCAEGLCFGDLSGRILANIKLSIHGVKLDHPDMPVLQRPYLGEFAFE